MGYRGVWFSKIDILVRRCGNLGGSSGIVKEGEEQ